MSNEQPKIAFTVSVLVTCLGAGLALYPAVSGYSASNRFGYYVLGGFLVLMGLVSAVIFNTRSKVKSDVLSSPLLKWRNALPDGHDDGFPDEVAISEQGMLWGGELVPFSSFHCSLVDAWIDANPSPMLTVTYTSRDRVGRKSHNLRTPLPPELLPQAEGAIRLLISKYRLESAALKRNKRRRN